MREAVLLRVIFLFLLLTACSKENGDPKIAAPEAPKLDFSTPDRALKSYWAQKDWFRESSRLEQEEFNKKNILAKEKDIMAKVTTGEVREFYIKYEPVEYPKYRREILSVNQETQSRAVALVKITNIAPIPRNAEPTSKDLEEREKGEQFRYVLESDGNEWKVAEVSLFQNYLGGWRGLYRIDKPSVPKHVFSD